MENQAEILFYLSTQIEKKLFEKQVDLFSVLDLIYEQSSSKIIKKCWLDIKKIKI